MNMAFLPRFLRHALMTPWTARRQFPDSTLATIERAIGKSEKTHQGEICFAIEAELGTRDLWHGVAPRQRALQVFSQLRVWDTERNTGILIYVLLADHAVEIVADRAIASAVDQSEWHALAGELAESLKQDSLATRETGCVAAVQRATALLEWHFPANGDATRNPNEVSNRPVRL
jgi:uncharacterized membrane protein